MWCHKTVGARMIIVVPIVDLIFLLFFPRLCIVFSYMILLFTSVFYVFYVLLLLVCILAMQKTDALVVFVSSRYSICFVKKISADSNGLVSL